MSFINQTTVVSSTPDLVLPNVPCHSSVVPGNWVRMSSGIAIKALADSKGNSNILGLVETKTSSTFANVRVLGVSSALFSNLDETLEYFLSDISSGGMDTIVPTSPGHVVLKLGQPFNSTQFLVHKGVRIVRS